MKATLNYLSLVFACLFIINSCKKKDDAVVTPAPSAATPAIFTPAVTAVGTPLGISDSLPIGPSGGTILSPDGRLEILIPANALSSITSLGIQLITNNTPGGAGIAYRLTPAGQLFSLPVTIRFHYDANDKTGTDIRLLGIAFQKADRIWYSFVNPQLDSVAATVSIQTKHFTDWTLFRNLVINPPSAQIPVLSPVTLTVSWEEKGASVLEADGDELMALSSFEEYADGSQVSWAVNGTHGGTFNDGMVHPPDHSVYTVYTAPAIIVNMSTNPVEVTAAVNVPGSGMRNLSSEITVVDNAVFAHYKLTFRVDYSSLGAAGGFSGHCAWGAGGYIDGAEIYIAINDTSVTLDSIVNMITPTAFSNYGCNCLSVTFSPGGMLEWTDFSAILINYSSLQYHMNYNASTPTEIYQCPLTPPYDPPVTDDGTFVPIGEQDIITLPADSIVYPWSSGTLTIKHL